jgi:Rrf2 family protein
MFSRTVEYALRAVVFLAQQGRAATTAEISLGTKVPAPYLAKVLQALSAAGIVAARRGVGGGIALAVEPEDLSILTVVNAVDPVQRIESCPLGLASHGVRLCALHKKLDRAIEQVESAFADTTLAEILAEPTESIPLCESPKGRRPRA